MSGTAKRGKVRPIAAPRARDARMDRPVPPRRDPNWLFVMVPTDATKPVERVQVASHELRRWKMLAGFASTLMVCLLIAVAFAWPRSRAYGSLVQENLELKQHLEAVDRKMSEVDRILLRLRLYDAQLESLGAPMGDHGPVPAETYSNAGSLDAAGPDLEADGAKGGGEDATDEEGTGGGGDEGDAGDSTDDEGVRPAEAWANSIEARAQSFLDVFAKTEPNLNGLMEEAESLGSLQRALPSLWPSNGAINSGFGWRRNPFGVRLKFHSGVDIDGNMGDPIYAAADGRVLRAGWIGGYGHGIEISHGYGVSTLYGHCSELYVQVGQVVQRGDVIGAIGSSGRSTGPHLHFEVRLDKHPVDPLQYVQLPPGAHHKIRTHTTSAPAEEGGPEEGGGDEGGGDGGE